VSFGSVLGLIAFEGVLGLAILAALWPNRRSASRLLRRWGVADPTEAEQAQALTYLRRRRFWYPWLFVGLPAVLGMTGLLPDNQAGIWSIPAMLLIPALLAEMFAQRRSPAPVRSAVPVRRELTDLVPGWALVLHTIAALAAILMFGAALAGVGWAQRWYPTLATRSLWVALAVVVLSVLVVWVIVGLALRRPPVAELRIDSILRARSARVPVGLGIGTLCALTGGGHGDFRSMLIVVAGIFFWSIVAGPVRRPVPA
jgi:hypothetical protein